MLAPEMRGRLNGLFMAFVFLCGAMGSGLAAAVYAFRGWSSLAGLGAVLGAAALALFTWELWGEKRLRQHGRVVNTRCRPDR
jgi:cyanate permease